MLARLLFGYKATQCLYVAAKLNIADHLKSHPLSIDELAKLTNTNQDALYRVMRCLSTLGIFDENNQKIFGLNAAAEDLHSDSENTMKDFVVLCGEELYQSAGELLYSVQTGKPAFNHIYGMSHWEYLETHPEKAKIFHDAMEKGTLPMIREIIKHYDFSQFKQIVDIGGGKGQLVCEILSHHPECRGTVFDLPNAKIHTLKHIHENNLESRCEMVTGSFFDEIPRGDLYLLKVVLHDWDDDRAKSILLNCHKHLNKNGKLLIIEKVVEDNKNKDLACLGDINMLVTLTGRERRMDEFANLLNQCGFRLMRKIDTATVFSILEADLK